MNPIYTTIFSSALPQASSRAGIQVVVTEVRQLTVLHSPVSSLQSIRLYSRDEVASLQVPAVSHVSIQYKSTICYRIEV